MNFHHRRTLVRHTQDRTRSMRSIALLAALFITLVSLSHLGARPAFAIPPEPSPEPPDNEPYQPPDGFTWSRPSRVAQAYDAWIPDSADLSVLGHYDPAYVNPASFSVRFDGCQTATEAKTGTSINTYIWTLKGNAVSNNKCRYIDSFPAQGTYPVSLKIKAADNTVILDTVTEDVVVKDLLIVALGDSYGAGEGSPDAPQVIHYDILGQPMYIEQPARWWDERCHRSMFAPSARAAWMVEKANPQVSVTYISFACSGATINATSTDGADPLNPYGIPSQRAHNVGAGILLPYSGAVPPNPDRPDLNQIPAQVNQLTTTLTLNGPARQIDALLLDGGGNDMGFATIAGLCTAYYDCPTHMVRSVFFSNLPMDVPLSQQVNFDLGGLPDRYKKLHDALVATQLSIAHTYITEYPDPTSNDNGQFCDKILDDVIPGWMQPILAGLALAGWDAVPLPPWQINHSDNSATNEIAWASTTVLAGLNQAIIDAAATNHWTLVDGIADANGNLFLGHGYCASDNWIRRAVDSATMQGPGAPSWWLSQATMKTKGTLHPTAAGYQAIANRIFSKLWPDLFPNPGPLPTPPTFNAPDFSQSTKSANGWLTGHSVACPTGVANCALMKETVSVDASTSVIGEGLSVNGVATTCPSTLTPVNGVVCSMLVPNAQTVVWSFAFPSDGIYRLEFSVSARKGATAGSSQEVKVDLNNPTAGSSLSSPTPASGWFRTPVTVTLSGTDGNGSGIQSVQYTLDGGTPVITDTSAVLLRLETDGSHSMGYQVKDFTGRQSSAQSLSVKLDQTPPAITVITPTSAAYTLNQVVAAGYSCTDALSGLASCAGPVANSANFDTASPGTKTFTVTASDNAGNTASKAVSYQVGYNICVLFDQSKSYKLGSTVPVKLQLCDAKSANVSAAGTLPVATGLTQKDSTASSDVADSGNANPDNAFRFDATLNGYIYNLSTKGLTTGTWTMNFTVPGDPVSHSVQFDVK